MLSFNFFTYNFWYFLVFCLILILLVAYFTLLERKVISAVQRRNGPDSVGFFGLLQPIADALKLLFKEFIIVKNAYSIIFFLSPVMILFLGLLSWCFLPLSIAGSFFNSNLSFLWILCISSLDVYIIFLAGFSSSSKYAILGSIRSIVQMVSYEVTFSLLLAPVIFLAGSASLYDLILLQIFYGVSNFVYFMPNTVLIFLCLLAETNRAPFDLPEAEAELVAGYNVEYSSLPFAFFFLGEYLNMLTASVLIVIVFFSGWDFFGFNTYFFVDILFMYIKVFFFLFIIIWVRASLPRVRYNTLMDLCWKYCLPFSLSFLFMFISLYNFFLYTNLV